jgi:hypothetical protein
MRYSTGHPMVDRDHETPPPGFGEACSSIARAIAESRDLEHVLARVAAAARLVISFEAMGVRHAEAPDDAVTLTLEPGSPKAREQSGRPLRRADHSHRLRPEAGVPRRGAAAQHGPPPGRAGAPVVREGSAPLAPGGRQDPDEWRRDRRVLVHTDRAELPVRHLDAAAHLPGGAAPEGAAALVLPVLDGRQGDESPRGRRPRGGRERAPPWQGALRSPGGRRGGRGRTLLGGGRAGRVYAGLRTPRLRHHLVHDRTAARLVQHLYVSLGESIRGLLLPRYPRHIQAGIVLPTGEWRRWRQAGAAAVAERVRGFDSIFTGFAARPPGFHAVLPAGGHHPSHEGLGATVCS